MGSKNISLSNDVYILLKRLKLKGESFSDTIRRLATSKGQITEFIGLWKDISEEEFQEIVNGINSVRKNTLII